jgi:hypothetical protein
MPPRVNPIQFLKSFQLFAELKVVGVFTALIFRNSRSGVLSLRRQTVGKNQINIIVTGGSNNNYYSIGGVAFFRSVEIDKWR